MSDVEWYHRLRNQLYHSGNGITVERSRVEAYFQIGSLLFENMFGTPLQVDESAAVHTKTGEFLRLWNLSDHGLRKKLPPKEDLAYYWKRDFIAGVSEEAANKWEVLNAFRNQLVHSLQTPSASELNDRIHDLRSLMDSVGVQVRESKQS